MTIEELEKAIMDKCNLTRADAARFVKTFTTCLADALIAGDSVALPGVGTLKVITKAARKGRNPRTGDAIDIPERNGVKFAPGKLLKDAIK